MFGPVRSAWLCGPFSVAAASFAWAGRAGAAPLVGGGDVAVAGGEVVGALLAAVGPSADGCREMDARAVASIGGSTRFSNCK